MRTIRLETAIKIAEHVDELAPQEAMLLQKAKEAAKNAYAPYSNFKVGAALLLRDGTVVIGNNQENAAYPVTMCAERTAIFAAAAQYPHTAIEMLALTVESQGKNIIRPVPPCGSCRQVIYEQERRHDQDIRIIMQGDSGEIYCVNSVKDILPLSFDDSYL